MNLPMFYVDDIIKRAIDEDINYVDVTTDYLIPDDSVSDAYYVAKDTGILCGIEIAKRVFELVGNDVDFNMNLEYYICLVCSKYKSSSCR